MAATSSARAGRRMGICRTIRFRRSGECFCKRSIEVQEVVESCCKSIGGKFLFIGTGQTAVTGTANLKKLQGQFTIRVELSDADVDASIRKVILAKKPDAIGDIEKIMQTNLGEVSRHLPNTSIGHRQDDIPYFAQDYPIATLQLKLPGAGAQLRSSSMKRICEKLFSFSLRFRSV